ncbi:hypothetical protein [Mycolicibacterium vaccae]|uniref:hypothetical protein n=1 Tax=Mycolicibacterium vaccae TaxID=1810 RepID=UPI003D067EDF
MNPLWQWVGTGGLAALISLAISWPKTRGEGKQASGAGQLSLTEAQVKAQENALKSAESAATRAEDMCRKCEVSREKMESDFKRFIGFVDDELVPLLPDPAVRHRARVKIRETWQEL